MEKIITQAIIDSYLKELLDNVETDVIICGAGPSGLLCGYYLAKEKIKVTIFERHLKVGGGMPGGGIMFNKIAFQKEVLSILDEIGISYTHYKDDIYVADSIETISCLTYKTVKSGVKIFNLFSVEDVVVRENRVCGVVINWTAVQQSSLHVDPIAIISKYVVDATGHDCEVAKIVEKKLGWIKVKGEQPMWAQRGEEALLENTKEVCPGLVVCGMAANAFFGSYRMGAIFGGMFLSGKKAAELIKSKIK
ncbi:MAG: sulfide-dependent adenosine diphosphate thiazole synthase [Elusimicrobiota bacterium]|nr:sulfide-dependent adenosine diphosphate thiazole synthase [Endomicrobiia bacterium]MCX7910654.1 sulfide-dependent adenosine diphosphate thiazole synthase [Endomicrobiia bacterium]MDW8166215.1 sulfide-dependent adenosine diphosphate thiazole synthase [Elusimicrobiota bacterium]